MEPDVIRIYSSSPPPMEDATEDEDNEVGDFGDFGGFSGVPNSISFTEFDTPTTFNQTQALSATSPPELLGGGGGRAVTGFSHSSSNGALGPGNDLSKANGVAPSERTEMKKALSGSLELSASEPADCNGGGTEVLTNGFATFDLQGSPSSQNSVHSHVKGTSTGDTGGVPAGSPEDDFADFAAFSNAEGRPGQTAGWDQDSDEPSGPSGPSGPAEDRRTAQVTPSEDGVRDTKRTGPDTDSSPGPAEAPDGSCNTDRGPQADPDSQRDVAFAREHLASEAVCTTDAVALNGADGADSKDAAGCSDGDLSPGDAEAGQADGKGSGNDTETETETETSLGRPLSTDALEEYGDASTTGSAPSPPLQGETATPGELSQLAEDDEDEDFGDFGDAGAFGGQGFADFDQLDVPPERSAPPQETPPAKDNDDDFGDFNSPKFHSGGTDGDVGDGFADFPVSDSFGNFSSAAAGGADGGADAGWSAFGEAEQQAEGESWAAFSTEQSAAPPAERREEEGEEEEEVEEEEEEEWHESEPVSDEASRTDRQTASLSSRLEKLFQSSFPPAAAPPLEDQVSSLRVLLGPPAEKPDPGAEEGERPPSHRSLRGGVWTQLQDIHEALGLRYQWGGSHCNKALLCCLGIDTRNILFTGQKKQPVIVPMYAASLGMLEPTKEPVKPVSAAEMIASIAQAPPVAPEKNTCPPDSVQQEALPPVQFDWSSSGLTNPLDASGGSSLLNLDFFGPVEDSGSSSSPSIPGVDPELFELTTAKMDAGGSGSRVADAFARLMSTMEKTSTSTRKPTKKEENLSEEASKVIAALPDLSFMQAKVLMFPATLTPLGCQATPD